MENQRGDDSTGRLHASMEKIFIRPLHCLVNA